MGETGCLSTRALHREMSRARFERAGRRAETLACLFLRLKGYQILRQRYKSGSGEIDIIARHRGILAIIEVKQRATLDAAEDSLTPYAIRRISSAADDFVARTPPVQSLAVRFDAVFLIGAWRMTHLKDAWRDR